jgi:hypothetical protein
MRYSLLTGGKSRIAKGTNIEKKPMAINAEIIIL